MTKNPIFGLRIHGTIILKLAVHALALIGANYLPWTVVGIVVASAA